MPIKVSKKDGKLNLRVDTDLTIFQVSEVYLQLVAAAEEVTHASIEFIGDIEIDTAAVQLLLAFKKKLRASGGELSVNWESEKLDEIFDLFNLKSQFSRLQGSN